jgi:hypothetical protein
MLDHSKSKDITMNIEQHSKLHIEEDQSLSKERLLKQ